MNFGNVNVKDLIQCFRYSDEMSIGDEVLVNGNNAMIPAKVVNISSLTMQGSWWFSYYSWFLIQEVSLQWVPFK